MPDSPQSLFDELAEGYEEMRRELAWDPFPHIHDAFQNLEGIDILDAGCGTGEVTRWLASQGARPYGLDISPEMCYLAAERSENIPYLTHDLSDPLPFDDGRFDAVIALGCLEYIPEIEKTVQEFQRVLRPGGTFLGCFERFGDDCPNGNDPTVVFFDNWMRYRQSREQIRAMFSRLFHDFEMASVPGFILEETDERTQYIRVIAHKP